jgi:hypothetical protein
VLDWLRKRREGEQRAAKRAERLIRDLGTGAHAEARRCEREALDLEAAANWRRVALNVAKKRGIGFGVIPATRWMIIDERG